MESPTITLATSDGETVETTADLAKLLETVASNCFDESGVLQRSDGPIPAFTKAIPLRAILAYCDHYVRNPKSPEKENELNQWENAFFAAMGYPALFEFIGAADFLAMRPALNMACKYIAIATRGKTAEQISAQLRGPEPVAQPEIATTTTTTTTTSS